MSSGQIKVRTRFTIDPAKGDPTLVSVDMAKGAMVEASWTEKGFLNIKPIVAPDAEGTAKVHFTLAPSLEASIYGINVAYNASQLVNMLPGASFGFNAQKTEPLKPWGFEGAAVKTPGPALDQSTIFGLPFSTLGVSSGIAEGTLNIQATTSPTFKYTTKEVRLDGIGVTAADGVAKVPAMDADFMEIVAIVNGELVVSGDLDIRPVVKVDSVAGYPTFGLVKFSFSAVKKAYVTPAQNITFPASTIHIPLPNVKVPAAPIGLGDVKAGGRATKTITIDNTGELGGQLEFSSSDPRFSVPSGKTNVPSKGKYELEVGFSPDADGPASATITVKSNDPDSPEQTFKIGANGADIESDDGESTGSKKGQKPGEGVPGLEPIESDGCSAAPAGTHHGTSGAAAALGLGLAVALASRRRRK
jgi:MYXO-CTERM domain-containing protein